MTRYLIDTNVLIEAKNRYYGFDFCPAFWSWLERQNQLDKVFSIEKVADEILKGEDKLSEWTKVQGDKFFLAIDDATVLWLKKLSEWASSQNYENKAIKTFSNGADYLLVAYAKAHGMTVVTQEVASETKKKIKIPNACAGIGVDCINLYEMLSREKARFVLGNTPVETE